MAVTLVRDNQRAWVLRALEGYWPGNSGAIAQLPAPRIVEACEESIPPRFLTVPLPDWACENGVDGGLLVPAQFAQPGEKLLWQRIDWLAAAFWYLHACAERQFEATHGPIHSFRFKLRDWDDRHWDHAWANRIGLLLRTWSARSQGLSAQERFGPLPRPAIHLTHDVDAVRKTLAIRLKQAAFHGINSVRSGVQGRLREGSNKLLQAIRFFCQRGRYWRFDEIQQLEKQHQVKSQFNFYGGPGGLARRPRDLLFDPGYSVEAPALRQALFSLRDAGWGIGLHPSFGAWNDADRIGSEKARLERALGETITQVRMHWLRFSWQDTWLTQQACGLRGDSTLGFNDRPGFRSGAALAFHPWDPVRQQPMTLRATPMMLMDSQVYDYAAVCATQRRETMARLIREVLAVAGEATIIWHPHVLSPDYGWREGYCEFLHLLGKGGKW